MSGKSGIGHGIGICGYRGSDAQKWQIQQYIAKTGLATYQYSGGYCKYDLKLTYYGKAPIKFYINNIKVDEWYANQIPGPGVDNPLTTRVLKNIFLNPGDIIKIESFIQGDEFVCIDKLELASLVPKTTFTEKGNLVNFNYSYDPVGNIQKINGDYYDYDGLNRLIWTGNVPTLNDVTGRTYVRGLAWSYDEAGNMTGKQAYQNGLLQQSITLGYDLANRLLNSGPATYTNGNVGERLTKTQGSDLWNYIYDGESRLKSVSKNGSTLTESDYDGAGMRYKKVSNGKTTYYIYSGSNVIAEYTPADGKYKYYIYAGKRSIAEEKDGNKVFYHRDHLGSTRALTDQNKKLVGLSKYDAWGKLESTNEYDEGVINGDMELADADQINYWQVINDQQTSGDCSYIIDGGLNGSAAIRITRSANNPNAAWSLKDLFVSPDTDYVLTGFYLSGDANSTKAKSQLVYYDANGNVLSTDDTGILGYSGTDWKQFSLSSHSPANAATMEILLTADNDAEMSYSFDGIRLKVPGLQNQDMFDYTGKKEDEGTGLNYFGARFYDPEVGRFLTLDPKKDGQNWFIYCRDNPIGNIDPDGCLTMGLGGSASAAFLGRIGLSGTIVVDDKGNIGIAIGGDIGAGFPNASAGGAAQVTTANNIFDLNGASVNAGFIFGGGIEIIMTDNYIGANISIKPVTTPTPDAHAVVSGTKVYSLNWLPESVRKEGKEIVEKGLREIWDRLPDDVKDKIEEELGLPDDFMEEETTESDTGNDNDDL